MEYNAHPCFRDSKIRKKVRIIVEEIRYFVLYKPLFSRTKTPLQPSNTAMLISYSCLSCTLNLPKLFTTKKNITPGPDNISYRLLRQLSPPASSILLNILNRLWLLSTVPSEWIHVLIVPVPKTDPNQYRPIALMSCIWKIVEFMICTSSIHWLELNSLRNIFGFRHQSGTIDCISTLVADICTGCNRVPYRSVKRGNRTYRIPYPRDNRITYQETVEFRTVCMLNSVPLKFKD